MHLWTNPTHWEFIVTFFFFNICCSCQLYRQDPYSDVTRGIHCYHFHVVILTLHNACYYSNPSNSATTSILSLSFISFSKPSSLTLQSHDYFSPSFFFNLFFNWRKIALQCCGVFCYTTMQISYDDTYYFSPSWPEILPSIALTNFFGGRMSHVTF